MSKKFHHGVTAVLLFLVITFFIMLSFDVTNIMSMEINKAASVVLFFIFIALLLIHTMHRRDNYSLVKKMDNIEKNRRNFFNMVSSELNEPVAQIRGYTELYVKEDLNNTGKKYAERAAIASGRLHETISHMIDAAELSEGAASYSYSDFDVEELVSTISSDFGEEAKNRGLTISKDGLKEIIINSDRDKVYKVLFHLMYFALQNTKGGDVKISFEGRGDNVDIHIQDESGGVSSEEEENIFERFYRLKSLESEEVKHTGLGLWLSREIMRELNGDVVAKSNIGKGTKFTVSIPVVRG